MYLLEIVALLQVVIKIKQLSIFFHYNKNQDHNQNLENNSLNKQIANIIYLKFIDDAKEIIHLSQSVDTSNIQISGCN